MANQASVTNPARVIIVPTSNSINVELNEQVVPRAINRVLGILLYPLVFIAASRRLIGNYLLKIAIM